MRRIPFVPLLFFCASAFSQKNGIIKGIAFDTTTRQPIISATITLMQKKDSSLISLPMTDNNGRFELTGIQNGEYRLLITHVNYHDFRRLFNIDEQHKIIDLGNIIMNDRTKVLSEVNGNQRSAAGYFAGRHRFSTTRALSERNPMQMSKTF
jgi:5-hydroxyisourate hydrolase-like protein (transthyretin family)